MVLMQTLLIKQLPWPVMQLTLIVLLLTVKELFLARIHLGTVISVKPLATD